VESPKHHSDNNHPGRIHHMSSSSEIPGSKIRFVRNAKLVVSKRKTKDIGEITYESKQAIKNVLNMKGGPMNNQAL